MCLVDWPGLLRFPQQGRDPLLNFFSFSSMVYHRILNIVARALQCGILLSIHSPYKSSHLLIPTAHSIPPSPPAPLGNHQLVLHVHDFVSVSQIGSFVLYFKFYKEMISYCISFSLSDLYDHLLVPLGNYQLYLCCCKWPYFILFLGLSYVPLCMCSLSTTYSLSIHLSTDIKAVFLSWLW